MRARRDVHRDAAISMSIGGPRSGFVQLHVQPGAGHNLCTMLCGTGFAPFFTRCKRAVQLNVGPFCKKRFERSYASTMKVSEVLSKLKDDGWELVATKGSHRQFKH